MRLSRKSLAAAKLYLILDGEVSDQDHLLEVLKDAVRGGIDVVQLRDKKCSAKEILEFSRKILAVTKHRIPFIVNDRADLALISGADGLHIGQEDLDCGQARKLLGPGKIIGVSCQTLAQARKAQASGADYIGFGSVFKTKTKPGRQAMELAFLKKVLKEIKIPVFPIGGINRQNIGQIVPLGANRAAVCRDILLANDPALATRELRKHLHITGL